MGLFKKKKVPDELPELALDDLASGEKEVHEHLKSEEVNFEPKPIPPASKEVKTEFPELKSFEPLKKDNVSEEKNINKNIEPIKKVENVVEKTEVKSSEIKPTEIKKSETSIINKESAVADNSNIKDTTANEKSFFGDLQKGLNEEITDFKQFETWYKDKFENRDVIKDMKSYWEGQKTESIIRILGKNFQDKISLKISKLQNLEKEWQKNYFDLIEKEEEIKEQELELKDLLSEFVNLCKNKVDEPKKESIESKKDVIKDKKNNDVKSSKEFSIKPKIANKKEKSASENDKKAKK